MGQRHCDMSYLCTWKNSRCNTPKVLEISPKVNKIINAKKTRKIMIELNLTLNTNDAINSPLTSKKTTTIKQIITIMKKETWKLIVQILISILTALGTTLGVTSCIS